MDTDRPLAVVSVGGITLLVVGAVVGGLVGWPPATPVDGVSPSALATLLAATLVVVAVGGATLWGLRTAPRADETPYWDD